MRRHVRHVSAHRSSPRSYAYSTAASSERACVRSATYVYVARCALSGGHAWRPSPGRALLGGGSTRSPRTADHHHARAHRSVTHAGGRRRPAAFTCSCSGRASRFTPGLRSFAGWGHLLSQPASQPTQGQVDDLLHVQHTQHPSRPGPLGTAPHSVYLSIPRWEGLALGSRVLSTFVRQRPSTQAGCLRVTTHTVIGQFVVVRRY